MSKTKTRNASPTQQSTPKCLVISILASIIAAVTSLTSCNNLLEIDPPKESVNAEVIFSSDITALSAMTGMYHDLMSATSFASGNFQSITFLAGLSSDELTYNPGYLPNSELDAFNRNDLAASNPYILSLWKSLYKSIYASNTMIENLESSHSLGTDTRNQLKGEALFLRAFCHFYAANLFGDVPLVTQSDYRINSNIRRTDKATIYKRIIDDLLESKELLKEDYIRSIDQKATDRARINKYAAAALLARVYLYSNDWHNAELEASFVLDNTTLYALNTNLDLAFLANSGSQTNKEAIWQLMPVAVSAQNVNTWEGNLFVVNKPGAYRATVTNDLLAAFEPGDKRRGQWIGTFNTGSGNPVYFANKYKIKNGSVITEHSMVLRLAEQYLIRAEAYAMQGQFALAQADINAIRKRAGLGDTPAADQTTLLSAISQERRVELFTEWGHRWFDLIRWNLAEVTLSPSKSPTWQATDILYPFPQTELIANSRLEPQNPGY